MKKTFILDTNVLLHDPKALFAFGENDVVVPIYVIEEIDQFKRDLSELGRNARQVSRLLDAYREKGNLGTGVTNEKGACSRCSSPSATCPGRWPTAPRPTTGSWRWRWMSATPTPTGRRSS